jgi:N2-acetyl-L-2,4-diaminobutanoate deacetylase
MTRIIARPNQLDLDSPGRRDYWVALEHDSLWGDYLIPLTIINGPKAKEGQGLVAFGSNHGNEYEGPMVIKGLLGEIKTSDVIGRLILVPVLNAAAFRAGTRSSTLDDNVNLNRAFIDGAGKVPGAAGITHRIAAFVREYIWPRVHVVIDLHSGGAGYQFSHVASFHPVDDPVQSKLIEDTARWFGTPLVMTYQNQTPGLLPSEAERLGKITVGTELGWGNAVDIDGVRWGRQGVLAAAINHKQLAGKIKPIDYHKDGTQRRVAMVSRDCFTVAPFSGHYQPILPCGSAVKKGTTVGLLHDFERIDEPGWEVKAGVTGVVIAQAYQSVVVAGTHILVTGTQEKWA